MSATPKIRATQTKPTRDEVKAAWERLRQAADQGSVHASALLIALVENKPVMSLDYPAA
jgi:hypothetical protein